MAMRGAPEVRGLLRLPHGLHEHVLDDYGDVRARKAVRPSRQLFKVALGERIGRVSQVHLEHVRPRCNLRQRNVYPLHRHQVYNSASPSCPSSTQACRSRRMRARQSISSWELQGAILVSALTENDTMQASTLFRLPPTQKWHARKLCIAPCFNVRDARQSAAAGDARGAGSR